MAEQGLALGCATKVEGLPLTSDQQAVFTPSVLWKACTWFILARFCKLNTEAQKIPYGNQRPKKALREKFAAPCKLNRTILGVFEGFSLYPHFSDRPF
jgi:hypothetical protein